MLAPVKIDLWLWSLDDETMLRRVGRHLQLHEQQRAARFIHQRDQNRFTAGRGRLREILAQYLTGVAPADLAFDYNEQGKPSLSGDPRRIRFNLSHSGGLAALGVTFGVDIGVDIEGLHPVEPELPAHYFCRSECEELQQLSGDEWLRGFFRCWTRKEAIVKAIGEGLSLPLDEFAVSLSPGAPAALLWRQGDAEAPLRWSLSRFDAGDGFEAVVAAETGGAPLELRLVQTPMLETDA